jgi:hypothetical protein
MIPLTRILVRRVQLGVDEIRAGERAPADHQVRCECDECCKQLSAGSVGCGNDSGSRALKCRRSQRTYESLKSFFFDSLQANALD